MTTVDLIAALDLPAGSRIDQRVSKKLLLENGAPTVADRHRINEGVEELLWLAALKPTTIGVPAFCDDAHDYLEIAVLSLTLRIEAKGTRLVELLHRAVPYPVLLLTDYGAKPGLSAAHKRWSLGEASKTVIEGDIIAVSLDAGHDAELWPAFRDALALARQPGETLYSLYQGWIDSLEALLAARITGTYSVAANAEHAVVRREALRECARLESEIVRLRAAASTETQVARQVELNLELKRIEAELVVERKRL